MNTKGFTLIELIVAISIGLIIMLAIYAASDMGQRTSVGVGRKVVTMQDARAALDLMAIEISMASFNPLRKPQANNIWLDSNCAVSANQGYKGLQIAKFDEMLIEMDIAPPVLNAAGDIIGYGNGIISKDEDNEIIYYKYNATDKKITRNVSCDIVDQPLLGGANAETNVINNSEKIPLFRYYDKAGNDIANDPAAYPPVIDQSKIPTIRRVEITIAAETAGIDPNTQQKRKMIYSTTVIVRNHVLSP